MLSVESVGAFDFAFFLFVSHPQKPFTRPNSRSTLIFGELGTGTGERGTHFSPPFGHQPIEPIPLEKFFELALVLARFA
jgi:hypothetical protein